MTFFLSFLYISISYEKSPFGPDDVRARVRLGINHLYPQRISSKDLRSKRSSLFWLNSATVRNEQLTSRSPPQERSNLSKTIPDLQHIALASASHFYLRWVSSIWFSLSILHILSHFFLVDLSSTSSRDRSLLHTGSCLPEALKPHQWAGTRSTCLVVCLTSDSRKHVIQSRQYTTSRDPQTIPSHRRPWARGQPTWYGPGRNWGCYRRWSRVVCRCFFPSLPTHWSLH